MKDGVTFIGTMLVDLIKMIDNYPEPGALCNMGEITNCIGGLACNTAVNLKVLDPSMTVRSVGMVGQDERGVYLREKLSSYGIDISGIKESASLPTSFTDVMTMRSTGVRTFFQQQGACANFSYDDIDFDSIETSHAHVGYALLMNRLDNPEAGYGSGMARILDKLTSLGLQTSIDLVSDVSNRYRQVVTPSLPYTDFLFCNEVEAAGITGLVVNAANPSDDSSVRAACTSLLTMGVRKMVILHAPRGGWIMTADGSFYFCPSLSLPEGYIQGSVGAGDAFCAGMLYALVRGLPPEEGLVIANLAAAANLSNSNSVDGMRPLADLRRDSRLIPTAAVRK